MQPPAASSMGTPGVNPDIWRHIENVIQLYIEYIGSPWRPAGLCFLHFRDSKCTPRPPAALFVGGIEAALTVGGIEAACGFMQIYSVRTPHCVPRLTGPRQCTDTHARMRSGGQIAFYWRLLTSIADFLDENFRGWN